MNPCTVYRTFVGLGWTHLWRTMGGVGMSRQRLPVEKECWNPAVLIRVRRKEKWAKCGTWWCKRWQWKVSGFGHKCKTKNQTFSYWRLTFTCFSLHSFRLFSYSLVVQLLSVQLAQHLELMRQLYCLGGEVLSAWPSAHLHSGPEETM